MSEWVSFDQSVPDSSALVVYYIPEGNYAWGTGGNYDAIKKEYPTVSHWKILTTPPSV